MKAFIFLIAFLFVITGVSYAQSNVVDTHPEAGIYVIDYSTGQKVQVNYDTANLFKDAFIDLVINTDIAQRESRRRLPGDKQLIVEQLDPQQNGNAFKLELQSHDRYNNMIFTIYTFVYNADNNTLAFLNQQYQRYVPVQVDGQNQDNLNNCYSYGLFNAQGQQTTYAQNTDDFQPETPVDVDVTTDIAPPEMPEYDQPECPADGYLWQPGYWGYNPGRAVYYWVPGAWVAPPTRDVVWTPPYWGYEGRSYIFHAGYWGPHVGFYGGINYGYGYSGHGFYGGEWRDNRYHYNTAVTHVNTTVVRNTYVNTTVVNNTVIVNKRFSFNGSGGVLTKPTQTEIVAVHERHEMPTPEQNRNQQWARGDKNQFATPGGGKPANVAVERVPVKRVNDDQQIRVGFRGNGNNQPGMNQQPNQNGRTFERRDPPANGFNRPAMNQQPNQNGGNADTRQQQGNGNNRPDMNRQPNQNGGNADTRQQQGNGNNRPDMNRQPNQNGGNADTRQPANNGDARPETNQQPNQNNGTVGTNDPAANGGRSGTNHQFNLGGRSNVTPPANNGAATPAVTEPANQNNGKAATAPPVNNGGTRPVVTEPANQGNGRVGVTPFGGNGVSRPSTNPPATNSAPAVSNPAPAVNTNQRPATQAPAAAPANSNPQKRPIMPSPNPRNKKIKQDN